MFIFAPHLNKLRGKIRSANDPSRALLIACSTGCFIPKTNLESCFRAKAFSVSSMEAVAETVHSAVSFAFPLAGGLFRKTDPRQFHPSMNLPRPTFIVFMIVLSVSIAFVCCVTFSLVSGLSPSVSVLIKGLGIKMGIKGQAEPSPPLLPPVRDA